MIRKGEQEKGKAMSNLAHLHESQSFKFPGFRNLQVNERERERAVNWVVGTVDHVEGACVVWCGDQGQTKAEKAVKGERRRKAA